MGRIGEEGEDIGGDLGLISRKKGSSCRAFRGGVFEIFFLA